MPDVTLTLHPNRMGVGWVSVHPTSATIRKMALNRSDKLFFYFSLKAVKPILGNRYCLTVYSYCLQKIVIRTGSSSDLLLKTCIIQWNQDSSPRKGCYYYCKRISRQNCSCHYLFIMIISKYNFKNNTEQLV